MRFNYQVKKSKKYNVMNPDFPNISGVGDTEDEAFHNFLTTFFDCLRSCLKVGVSIPIGKKTPNLKSFGLPLNMTLKIKLHNLRIENDVPLTELAHLLALTYKDVVDDDWSLPALRRYVPVKKPKYKNVQRLFNIDHDSTVREIEQAFRVLGYGVDVTPYRRDLNS